MVGGCHRGTTGTHGPGDGMAVADLGATSGFAGCKRFFFLPAPHMHVLVCVCSNLWQFQNTESDIQH